MIQKPSLKTPFNHSSFPPNNESTNLGGPPADTRMASHSVGKPDPCDLTTGTITESYLGTGEDYRLKRALGGGVFMLVRRRRFSFSGDALRPGFEK